MVISYLGTEVVCKPGWDMFESVCYKSFATVILGKDLKSACAEQNSTGVVINSQMLSDFINSKYAAVEHWIGLSYGASYWEWSDGSLMDFTNWFDPSYPTDRECVVAQGTWKDRPCASTRAYYICQYRPEGKNMLDLTRDLPERARVFKIQS